MRKVINVFYYEGETKREFEIDIKDIQARAKCLSQAAVVGDLGTLYVYPGYTSSEEVEEYNWRVL